jgi:hypothetical protein
MALYTYFLCRDCIGAGTFEAIDLPADEDARALASSVLADHPSAEYVSIWQGDRAVGEARRERLPYPFVLA